MALLRLRLSQGGGLAPNAACLFCDCCLRIQSEQQIMQLAAIKLMTMGVGTSALGEVMPEGRGVDIGTWHFDRRPIRNAVL